MAINVLIAEPDDQSRRIARDVVSSCADCAVVGIARDCQEAVEMTLQLKPHIVLLSYDMAGLSGLGICETLVDLAPEVITVAMAESKSQEILDAAMRAGARAVLSKPLDVDDVEAVISSLASTQERCASPDLLELRNLNNFPKIITVTGASGGIGKSTLACNLAVTLARYFPRKVALLDMHSQFGDVATMMNVRATRTIDEIRHMEMDKELLSNYVIRHSSGVDILALANEPQEVEAISPKSVDDLLYLLKANYRFTIIDLPQMLQESSLHVFAQSHHVLLVSNLNDVTTVLGTKKMYDLLVGARMPRENIKLVLNRVQKSNLLDGEEFRQAFRVDSVDVVPEEAALGDVTNEGHAYALAQPQSAFAQSLVSIAEKIAGETLRKEEKKRISILDYFRKPVASEDVQPEQVAVS